MLKEEKVALVVIGMGLLTILYIATNLFWVFITVDMFIYAIGMMGFIFGVLTFLDNRDWSEEMMLLLVTTIMAIITYGYIYIISTI